jgi:hypothetical protein
MMSAPCLRGRGGGATKTYRCAGTVVAAQAEVVDRHLPGLLAVLCRGRILLVHNGSRRSGY